MSEIKRVNSLIAKLSALGGDVNASLSKGVLQGAHAVQAEAKKLAPGDTGQLRNSIYAELQETQGQSIARVYTNNEHAAYVEFGTGPIGEASDKGGVPGSVLSKLVYKQDGWYIHESQIDKATAEKYHFQRIETSEGVFYYTRGQAAQPFLYPALVRSKAKVRKLVRVQLKKDIDKLGGEQHV